MLLEEFKVDKKDRDYQFWKRRPLSVELYSELVYWQKIDYIHDNPVKAGLCKYPEEYKYSSAKYYELELMSSVSLTIDRHCFNFDPDR